MSQTPDVTKKMTLVESIVKIDDTVLSEYVHPPTGAQHEKDSFNFQSTRFNASEEPKTVDRAVNRLEAMLQKAHFELPHDFLEPQHVRRTVEYVKAKYGDKSPGAIFSREGLTTNNQVFDKYGVDGVIAKVERRIEELLDSLDTRYCADPVKLFKKREGHTKAKAAQKRWRLIWGISVIDNIIDRLIYTEMIEQARDNAAELPIKPGFNFKKGGVNRMVRKYGMSGSRGWRSFDSRGHDMSAPGWGLLAVMRLNQQLCLTQGSRRTLWIQLMEAREQAVLYGSFVFSDGTHVRKVKPGVQPSGRLTTIDSNSKLVLLFRVLYDIDTGVPSCGDENIAMGDDTVLDGITDVYDFVDRYLPSIGITWTIESEPGLFTTQNFCSMRFQWVDTTGTWVPIPLNWRKNLFSLCWQEGKADVTGQSVMSLMTEYAFDEAHFETLATVCSKSFPDNYRSRKWHQAIICGYEVAG